MTLSAARSATIPLAALSLALCVSLPAVARAQAWVPVQREASVSLHFQQINLDGHFWGDGSRHEGDVPSRAHVAIVNFEYGVTDKLALTARLPYIASKFAVTDDPGTIEYLQFFNELQKSTPGGEAFGSLDTGAYYATFQDVALTLRYNLLRRGLVVTPVIGVTIPTHDYRTVGEAAPGQNRRALQTGASVGRLLDPFLPAAYVHAQYTYSFVQRLFDVSLDRSNAEFEVGYAITPLVGVRALAAWSQVHGGLGYEEALADPFVFLSHDRLLASRYWHLGAGTTVSLTDSIDLDAAVLRYLAGADTHFGVGMTVGLTWRFMPAAPRSTPSTRFRSPLYRK